MVVEVVGFARGEIVQPCYARARRTMLSRNKGTLAWRAAGVVCGARAAKEGLVDVTCVDSLTKKKGVRPD